MLEKDGPWIQNLLTIIDILVNTIWGDMYDHLMTQRTFNLRIDWIFIRAPRIMRKVAMSIIGFANIPTNRVFHVLLEVSGERERLPFSFSFFFFGTN